VFVLVLHHIASDGWSTAPLARDLARAYTNRSHGKTPQQEALPVQYADYTLWQEQLLGSETDPASVISQQITFWKETLEGSPEELELPTDRPRPAKPSYRGKTVQIKIEPHLHYRLLSLARDNQAQT
jgi:Condensation domain